jgi:hypothetical protein
MLHRMTRLRLLVAALGALSNTPLLLAAGGVGVLAFGTLALLLTRRARFKA